MPQVVFPEFREQYKLTKYPFTDTSTLTSTDGRLVIPNDMFIDASFYIPCATAPLYIKSITITEDEKVITVSDTSKKYTATGTLSPLSETVKFKNEHGCPVGIMIFVKDGLGFFSSIETGEYQFNAKSASFVPRCFIELNEPGVTSIGTVEESLTGNVWLCGKDGIIIRAVSDTEFRIDIVGEPLFKQTICNTEGEFDIPNPLLTINGMEPDSKGNFKISVLDNPDILRINTTADGIQIFAAGE